MSNQLLARFWSKVQRGTPDECWSWLGSKAKGYGRFYCSGRTVAAHRFSYETAGHVIPAGLVLDHKCRNRGCVNPDHLRPVTSAQNTVENSNSNQAINKAKTTCIRGHSLDGYNVRSVKRGRRCRLCDNLWLREYRARKKAERHEQQ